MNIGGAQTFAQKANALMRDMAGVRKQVQVWLYLNKANDLETFEIIEYLKSKRQFRSSMMLGLKIVFEAGQGRYDTLLMSFPDVVEKLRIKVLPPPPTPPDNTDLLKEILENQRLILEQGVASFPPMRPNEVVMQSTTGKQIAAPTFALPVFEDDDDDLPTLKLAKSATNNATKNFLNGLQGLH